MCIIGRSKAEDQNHPYLEMYGDVEEVGGKLKASCSNKALGMEHLPIAKLRKLEEQGISPTGE